MLNWVGEPMMSWVIIPLMICIARITDVSIGTVRVIFVAKGMKMRASVLGFFEVIIWLVVIGQIMQNLTEWQNYIAYGLGFALGNYVGIAIESKLAYGSVMLRIVTARDATELVQVLREQDYGVTAIDAEGKSGPVKVIMMIVQRSQLSHILAEVEEKNPRAFYTIEDVRSVKEGIFPSRRGAHWLRDLNFRNLLRLRK